jgi:hypothetical protein
MARRSGKTGGPCDGGGKRVAVFSNIFSETSGLVLTGKKAKFLLILFP